MAWKCFGMITHVSSLTCGRMLGEKVHSSFRISPTGVRSTSPAEIDPKRGIFDAEQSVRKK